MTPRPGQPDRSTETSNPDTARHVPAARARGNPPTRPPTRPRRDNTTPPRRTRRASGTRPVEGNSQPRDTAASRGDAHTPTDTRAELATSAQRYTAEQARLDAEAVQRWRTRVTRMPPMTTEQIHAAAEMLRRTAEHRRDPAHRTDTTRSPRRAPTSRRR
jgi:hypothetical protein